jgi:hypothetical protein
LDVFCAVASGTFFGLDVDNFNRGFTRHALGVFSAGGFDPSWHFVTDRDNTQFQILTFQQSLRRVIFLYHLTGFDALLFLLIQLY